MNEDKSSSRSESEVSLSSEPKKQFKLNDFYDFESFPESTGAAVLPWTDFTRDFLSLDLTMTPAVKQICEDHLESLIDLRPYMIENPEKCTRYDFLPKIL